MFARDKFRLVDGAIVLVCAWLFVSPWVLNYDSDAGWNSTIAAVVIAVLAAVRALGGTRLAWLRQADWLTALGGLWLVVAPWMLSGYDNTAKWNSVIVGVVVAVFALGVELRAPALQQRQTTAGGTA